MNTHLTSELISSPSWPLSEPLPPWRILEIHPILHLQLFSGIWKKKWYGIFKVSPMALLWSPVPTKTLSTPVFQLCYLVISAQPQCMCLTLENQACPHMPESRMKVAGEETESVQHQKSAVSCSGSMNQMKFSCPAGGQHPEWLIWAVLLGTECGKHCLSLVSPASLLKRS